MTMRQIEKLIESKLGSLRTDDAELLRLQQTIRQLKAEQMERMTSAPGYKPFTQANIETLDTWRPDARAVRA